ncbi:MAG: hypothetical protein AB1656_07195 [Candidatus Omnitrophota bacterium]
MYKAFQTAFYEAKMSVRGWRFWLLLALLGGISLFARGDYIAYVDNSYFLHSGYSFQHPSFWLMLTILSLGAVALALDTCGRLRRNRMDKILFPLPFGPMELMWGRLLGVLIVIVPLSAAGFFSLGLWQKFYGDGYVVWQPFLAAYGLLVLPFLVPAAAIAITLRTYFKHDFAALLAGAVFIGGCAWMNQRFGLFVNPVEVSKQLANASPALGVRLSYGQYFSQLLVHALLSITVLVLAPLYLRRQEPQRWLVSRRKRYSLFAMPTLMRWLTDLKFDRHLGWRYRLTLTCCLLLCAAGALWAAFQYQENLANPLTVRETTEQTISEEMPPATAKLIRYEIEISPSPQYDRLDLTASVWILPTEETKQIGMELDPSFVVDDILLDEESCLFTQRQEKIRILFGKALAPGEEKNILFRYHGVPPAFHPLYSALEGSWHPKLWRKIKTETNKRWVDAENDLFQARIALNILPGQSGAFAGELVSAEERDGVRAEKWNTFYPVDALQIYWGRYAYVEKENAGRILRFYHLPTHDYQARVYMEEVKEQEAYVQEKLGPLPFRRYTLIETPYRKISAQEINWKENWDWQRRGQVSPPQNVKEMMPGLLTVSENLMSYLHEKIWLLDRLDRNPREIPYFLMLPTVLFELHSQFYNNLISAYFEHSLHPTGDLAFWLKRNLAGYAKKLLVNNSWWRKRALQFDVGTNPNLPLSIARRDNLLTLYRSGQYPQLLDIRGEGLFRMLHHILEEDKWWEFMKQIFQEYRFKELPIEEFLQLAEGTYGSDLSWFVKDWIEGAALPSYEITLAEAKAIENKAKKRTDYDVTVRVVNHGTGRAPVPIFIETEMDYIFRDLMLAAGEEKTLAITVPNRPIFAVVDPENWIVQEPYFNKEKRIRGHSERRIFIEGDEDTSNLRRNNDRSDWHGRRGGFHRR